MHDAQPLGNAVATGSPHGDPFDLTELPDGGAASGDSDLFSSHDEVSPGESAGCVGGSH